MARMEAVGKGDLILNSIQLRSSPIQCSQSSLCAHYSLPSPRTQTKQGRGPCAQGTHSRTSRQWVNVNTTPGGTGWDGGRTHKEKWLLIQSGKKEGSQRGSSPNWVLWVSQTSWKDEDTGLGGGTAWCKVRPWCWDIGCSGDAKQCGKRPHAHSSNTPTALSFHLPSTVPASPTLTWLTYGHPCCCWGMDK